MWHRGESLKHMIDRGVITSAPFDQRHGPGIIYIFLINCGVFDDATT